MTSAGPFTPTTTPAGYVDEVMSRAHAIATHAQYERTAVKHGTFLGLLATGVKQHPTISYQGNVLSHYDRLIAAANMVSAANFPYLYGGGHEQPAIFAPFDCSGSVSYVMQQAGYTVPTTVSGDIPIWKFPAGPGQVTIFLQPGPHIHADRESVLRHQRIRPPRRWRRLVRRQPAAGQLPRHVPRGPRSRTGRQLVRAGSGHDPPARLPSATRPPLV